MPNEIGVDVLIDSGRVFIDVLDLAKAVEANRETYEISLDYLIRDLDVIATQASRQPPRRRFA